MARLHDGRVPTKTIIIVPIKLLKLYPVINCVPSISIHRCFTNNIINKLLCWTFSQNPNTITVQSIQLCLRRWYRNRLKVMTIDWHCWLTAHQTQRISQRISWPWLMTPGLSTLTVWRWLDVFARVLDASIVILQLRPTHRSKKRVFISMGLPH